MSSTTVPPPWRDLIPAALIPNFMYNLGQGAIIPVAPVFAVELGASVAFAALAVGMLPLGQAVGTLPAGLLVSRVGERGALFIASAICVTGGLLCLLARDEWWLLTGSFLIGLAAATFAMARHAYITVVAPYSYRARILSLAAATSRLGLLVGPFCSLLVLALGGQERAAFSAVIASALAIVLVLMMWPVRNPPMPVCSDGRATVLRVIIKRRQLLLNLGTAASILGMIRASRQLLVPLWGAALDMSTFDIALLVGLTSVLDVGLSYTGGQLMDRFGRLRVAVPTLITFATAHAIMGALDLLPDPARWLVVVAASMAVVNGLSSGINATMGSDLADPADPALFLSSWRLVTDIGPAVAPLVLSAATALVSLAFASLAMAAVAFGGLVAFVRYVPRHLPRQR